MNKHFLLLIFSFSFLVSYARPYKRASIVKTYRTCMKEKKYTQARQVLIDAIRQHPEAAADASLYRYQCDAINELAVQENRKIYLNAQPDTARYFQYIYELYRAGLQCDSTEQNTLHRLHAEGKKAKVKYRSGVGQMLLPYRPNLLSAGKFHYAKKDYPKAYRYFDLYIQTKSSSLFLDPKGQAFLTDPDDTTPVSVLAVLSAYGSGHHQGVITYLSESLKDETHESQLLEIGSKAALALGDTATMVQCLQQGFAKHPDTEYFLASLTRYYNDRGQYTQALVALQRITQLRPTHRDYWYMMGQEQLLLQQYEEAIRTFQKCIEIQADDAASHASLGNIYLHQAHEAYAQFNLPLSHPDYARRKAAITERYAQSCKAFEQARKFDENNPALWLQGLRETYFKLNRGRELRRLEQYQKNLKK